MSKGDAQRPCTYFLDDFLSYLTLAGFPFHSVFNTSQSFSTDHERAECYDLYLGSWSNKPIGQVKILHLVGKEKQGWDVVVRCIAHSARLEQLAQTYWETHGADLKRHHIGYSKS